MMITNWRQDCEFHDKSLNPNATLSANVGNLARDDATSFSPSYCCLQVGKKRKSPCLSRCASPLVVNNVPGSPNKLTRGSGAIVVFSKPRWAASRLARAFHFRIFTSQAGKLTRHVRQPSPDEYFSSSRWVLCSVHLDSYIL
jgi:hypothetical protein